MTGDVCLTWAQVAILGALTVAVILLIAGIWYEQGRADGKLLGEYSTIQRIRENMNAERPRIRSGKVSWE